MLQISQIEKPRCSATIDQMRLRRAMVLPSEFQNFSSSGFQSAIHREFRVLIEHFLSERALRRLREPDDPGTFPTCPKQKPPGEALARPSRAAALPYWPVVGPAVRRAPSRLGRITSRFVPKPNHLLF